MNTIQIYPMTPASCWCALSSVSSRYVYAGVAEVSIYNKPYITGNQIECTKSVFYLNQIA